jgi:precorrin-3B synthase
MSGRVRGWCPSLFEPMASGDGLLARVKPPLGRLSAASLRAVAAAARAFGNGQIEITNRGAVQVRGLSEASLRRFQDTVLTAGLASADPAVERRRNLVVSPFVSPAEDAAAAELEQWIGEDATLAALPPKFGFGVATDSDPHPIRLDVCLTAVGQLWRIALAGGDLAAITETPVAALRAVVGSFLQLAAALDERPRRMADLVRRCGAAAVLAGAKARLVETRSEASNSAPAIAGALGNDFALGLPFGVGRTDQLRAAAGLAERFAEGGLRLSPWRALVLAGVADVTALAAEAHDAGFITAAADPRLALSACPGTPACASGQAAARADAVRLVATRMPSHVHVSGCVKGCAHPGPAAFTLVASGQGYDLVRRGRAGDQPDVRGLTLEAAFQLLAAETP